MLRVRGPSTTDRAETVEVLLDEAPLRGEMWDFGIRILELSVVISLVTAALVWGAHPLRAESVAWVSERRDVLCGLFYLVAVLAYLRAVAPVSGDAHETAAADVESPRGTRVDRRVRWWLASLAAFAILSRPRNAAPGIASANRMARRVLPLPNGPMM